MAICLVGRVISWRSGHRCRVDPRVVLGAGQRTRPDSRIAQRDVVDKSLVGDGRRVVITDMGGERCDEHEVRAEISMRITNEVREINRVVLDVTSKPPGTIEWE